MNIDNLDSIDIEGKEFEEGLKEMVHGLYKDVEIDFQKTKKSYSGVDIYEKTCDILAELFNNVDKNNNWEFNVTYESMQDLFNKNNSYTEL